MHLATTCRFVGNRPGPRGPPAAHSSGRKDALPLPPVALDRDHVGQIVWNLITNAAQAIQGHMQRPGTITVGAGVREERLHVEVCDTGPGLSASEAERICEPMYTTKVDGVGLGLSISRARVLCWTCRPHADQICRD